MHKSQTLWGPAIHAVPVGIMLLILISVFLNQTNFAASSPKTSNGSRQETTPSSAAPLESPLTNSACEKSPMQCSSLCQTALSAEFRATELEKHSEKARMKAEEDAKIAVFLEEEASNKLQHKRSSKNRKSSKSTSDRSKSIWKSVGIIPRLFVSKEANDRAREEEKEAAKHRAPLSPGVVASQETSELLVKSQEASKSASESQNAAVNARVEADQARAYAGSMRQSFKSCLGGMETR